MSHSTLADTTVTPPSFLFLYPSSSNSPLSSTAFLSPLAAAAAAAAAAAELAARGQRTHTPHTLSQSSSLASM
eukprot:19387-Rhodomonas_salina.1